MKSRGVRINHGKLYCCQEPRPAAQGAASRFVKVTRVLQLTVNQLLLKEPQSDNS